MEDIYRSQFRLPYSLYEQLKEASEQNHRSVNAELVARLEESLKKPPTQTLKPTSISPPHKTYSHNGVIDVPDLNDQIMATIFEAAKKHYAALAAEIAKIADEEKNNSEMK